MNTHNNFNEVIIGKNACYELVKQNPSLIKIVHLLKVDEQLINLLKKLHLQFIIHDHDHYFNKFNHQVNHQGYVIELKPTNSLPKWKRLYFYRFCACPVWPWLLGHES